jgi:hypothetical protein
MTEENKPQTPDVISEKRQESVRIITEQMTELSQVLENVKKDQAVDKNTAIGLEQISPGVVTEVIPINGFTETPSKTNYQLVINRIGDRIKVLGDEKRGIILDDEPFEKAEKAEEESEKVSEGVDNLVALSESVEAFKGVDVDSNTLLALHFQIEKTLKSIGCSNPGQLSMESFNQENVSTQQLIVSMEAGIWDSIKSAMEKFWLWIKETFKKIVDWLTGADPAKRLQGIESFMEDFKGDSTVFEVEVTDAEMHKLTLGGKMVPDVTKGLGDFVKLAELGSLMLPAVSKACADTVDLTYVWVSKNTAGLTKESLTKEVGNIAAAVAKKYPADAMLLDASAKKFSSVFTEEKDKITLHYQGGFTFSAELGEGSSMFRDIKKYSTGKDKSDVKGGKYKLRASDAQKIGILFKKVIETGWSDKRKKEIEDVQKQLDSFESKYKTVKDVLGKDEKTTKVAQELTMFEKTIATKAASCVTAHAQALKHLEAMEKFILGLYKKAQKAEDKKDDNKPAAAAG